MARWITALKRLGASDRLIRRNPALYAGARRLLEEHSRLDLSAQRKWREERLARVLAAAARTSYGRRCGAPRHLGDWPILEKDALRAEPAAFLPRPRGPSAAASTSGTTGTPLLLRRSFGSVAYEQAVLDWLLERAGIDPRRCRAAVLRGDDIKSPADRSPPFWRLANGGRRLVFSSNHLDSATVGVFVAALRDYAPEVLLAYPTVLGSLCALMLERGDTLAVPVTVCSSEVLTEGMSDIARLALHSRVIDYYGQAERVAFAYHDDGGGEGGGGEGRGGEGRGGEGRGGEGCGGDGYRFLASYSVNELRFVDSREDADTYELIGTSLWNRAMPLVRYRTGDLIRLPRGVDAASVAEGRAPFLGVLGRSGDFLIAPSGARLMGIDHIPRDVPRVVRAQFVQESRESVRLLVVPAPGFDADCKRLLLEHAQLKLPPSMTIRIETTAELVRDRSGKAPLVVRTLDAA
jgi:phenylacetate-CoA ligase